MAYTCRLLRKATATGARLVVRSDPDTLGALDAALWELSPADFVTHCRDDASDEVKARSAVLLQEAREMARGEVPILVNLADDVPEGFDKFERVIEIVSNDEQERSLARGRWKHYTERGYTITRHDLKSKAGN